MKRLLFAFAVLFVVFNANADATKNSRIGMVTNNIMNAPRYQVPSGTTGYSVAVKDTTTTTTAKKVDTREAERNACINNNIGVGNTFVWASKYSDTSNYANMVEDVEKPENNVCFVRVELKSDDPSRVSVSDIAPKYFMWGEAINCGGWVDQKVMEQRILDARKGARIGGIIASTAAGVGIGVGSMELFGNRLIGKKVEGQRSLEGEELYRSQLLVLKEEQPSQYRAYLEDLRVMSDACEEDSSVSEKCSVYKSLYTSLPK